MGNLRGNMVIEKAIFRIYKQKPCAIFFWLCAYTRQKRITDQKVTTWSVATFRFLSPHPT